MVLKKPFYTLYIRYASKMQGYVLTDYIPESLNQIINSDVLGKR